MSARWNRISIKYGAAFIGVALALWVVVAANFMLIGSLQHRMDDFAGTFQSATSKILNGDRDLYQARVALNQYRRAAPNASDRAQFAKDYQENVAQAHERMQGFVTLMQKYPDVVASVADFESRFSAWKQASASFMQAPATPAEGAADAQLEQASAAAFDGVRELYNAATDALNAKVAALQKSADRRANHERFWTVLFVALVGLASVLVALIGPKLMSRAVCQIRDRIREITAGDGDLTARIHSRRKDEIGGLASEFNRFIERIDQTLQAVRDTAAKVDTASDEIARGSHDLAARTEESAASLQETSASMEEITVTVGNTTNATAEASKLAEASADMARRGLAVMQDMQTTMQKTNTASGRIREIITMIDSIAFQTNILALNASVEAARAGEHGRGFAVVASEVRTLASRSGDASREIRGLVDSSVSSTAAGAELADQASRTMQEIATGIDKVTAMVAEINTGASEQKLGIGQVNAAVAQLDEMTQHNASLVEQTSAAAARMRAEAAELTAIIAGFHLSEGAADSALVATSMAVVPPRAADRPRLRDATPGKHLAPPKGAAYAARQA